jgi:hypothetical protein
MELLILRFQKKMEIWPAFKIRASRQRLRRLKEGAAYNIAQHLNSELNKN